MHMRAIKKLQRYKNNQTGGACGEEGKEGEVEVGSSG